MNPSPANRLRRNELVRQIDECNDFLKGKEIRFMFDRAERAWLVKVQRRKAMLIDELKMHVRYFANVPSDILERIYPF